jgi:hypothetical protein
MIDLATRNRLHIQIGGEDLHRCCLSTGLSDPTHAFSTFVTCHTTAPNHVPLIRIKSLTHIFRFGAPAHRTISGRVVRRKNKFRKRIITVVTFIVQYRHGGLLFQKNHLLYRCASEINDVKINARQNTEKGTPQRFRIVPKIALRCASPAEIRL